MASISALLLFAGLLLGSNAQPIGGKPPHFFPYHGKIVKGDLETLEFLSPNKVLTKFEGRTLSFSKIGQYLTPAVYHFSSQTFDILYEVYGINSPQPNDANIWMSVRCKNQPLHGRFQSEFQVSRTSSDTSIYVDKDYEISVASVRRLNQLKFWLRRRCGITTSHDDFTKVRQEVGGRFAPEVVVTVLNGEEIYLRKLP
ncbi:hypothetical protein Pmar_PMAR022769 [Perkinsus marinus ATCC 50983]|uniref:Uncharacterized protein n=1 Tax=Perkinsus marinus (strain ATCC 50983 / TXsc) TaxID=423536 RepID=C5KWU3_PERM5|nr:hypothetical protein Pmar_PMAR022769 [Perkinsus marinus ATCC 50983]EER11049.1 hypothetical protein Pmar_PMAR022769 [Perkinsus marinus ATCC 50983]|eukprot:XP_002779254.1 hypothetical protein Pmar_PMAR022769 [Perkinsus marinus ATCC 50983]